MLLRVHGIYLGLAHTKDTKHTPQLTGTKDMVYRHVFYAFSATPPFAMVAAGEPFLLPRAGSDPHRHTHATVQFASGMVVDHRRDVVFVSYSELDCGAALAEIPLDAVLEELGISGM